MDEVAKLNQRIIELEKKLKEAEQAQVALEAAGFDVWINNFATGENLGTNRRIFESIGYSEDELPKNLDELYRLIHPEDLKAALEAINDHFADKTPRYQAEMRVKAKDGSWRWIGNYGKVIERDIHGNVTKFSGVNFDINKRRIIEEELIEQNRNLRDALNHIKALQGIIPICCYCKKIRDDQGYWDQVESYISQHTDAEFSHSICPDCMRQHHSKYLDL